MTPLATSETNKVLVLRLIAFLEYFPPSSVPPSLSPSLSLPTSLPPSLFPSLLPSFPPSLPPFLPPYLLPSLPLSVSPSLSLPLPPSPSLSLPPQDSSIEITVNTTLLKQSGDWVNVSWTGVPDPSHDDWIGVYSPPVNGSSIDPQAHAPVKYQVSSWSECIVGRFGLLFH